MRHPTFEEQNVKTPLFCLSLAALTTIAAFHPAWADAVATVFQYELQLGRKPSGTFYIGYDFGGGQAAASRRSFEPALRVPLYSTDPGIRTAYSEAYGLFAAAGDDLSPPEKVIGVIGALVYFGAPIYVVVKSLSEAGDLDLSGISIDVPEVTDPTLPNEPDSRENQ